MLGPDRRDAKLLRQELEGGSLVIQFCCRGTENLRCPNVDVGFDQGLILDQDQAGEMQQPLMRFEPSRSRIRAGGSARSMPETFPVGCSPLSARYGYKAPDRTSAGRCTRVPVTGNVPLPCFR